MDKQTSAIMRLQEASQMSERLYNKPLLITYSGGKDSDVLLYLADVSGIEYEVKHSLTTVDAPQTVEHMRRVFHRLENDGINCTIDIHKRPEGGGSYDVEPYPARDDSPYSTHKILLQVFKRNWKQKHICCYGCAMG